MKIRNSCKTEASLTVEAAFVCPLSFFALYVFFWFFILLHTELVVYQELIGVSDGLYALGTAGAYADNSHFITDCIEAVKGDVPDYAEALTTQGFSLVSGSFSSMMLEKMLAKRLEEEDRLLSCIKNENDGFDCSGSKIYGGSPEISLLAKYVFEFPFDIFGAADIEVEQAFYMKGFYGSSWSLTSEFNDKERDEDELPEPETVYIVPGGSVYHCDSDCTYINISLSEIAYEELSAYRNVNGGIYYACSYCCDDFPAPYVYISKYGTRYHESRNCPMIERNVDSVSVVEAENMGRRPCSKCGGE